MPDPGGLDALREDGVGVLRAWSLSSVVALDLAVICFTSEASRSYLPCAAPSSVLRASFTCLSVLVSFARYGLESTSRCATRRSFWNFSLSRLTSRSCVSCALCRFFTCLADSSDTIWCVRLLANARVRLSRLSALPAFAPAGAELVIPDEPRCGCR